MLTAYRSWRNIRFTLYAATGTITLYLLVRALAGLLDSESQSPVPLLWAISLAFLLFTSAAEILFLRFALRTYRNEHGVTLSYALGLLPQGWLSRPLQKRVLPGGGAAVAVFLILATESPDADSYLLFAVVPLVVVVWVAGSFVSDWISGELDGLRTSQKDGSV